MNQIIDFIKNNYRNYFFISFGVLLVAISCNYFVMSLGISSGGVSGLGLVINHYFPIPISLVVYIVNILLLILAFFLIDKELVYRSIYGSLLFPFFLSLVPVKPLLEQDTLLSMIIGGLIMGTGFGIIFTYGGSTGGTSLVPYFLKKFFHIPLSAGLFLCDAIILGLSILIGGYLGLFYGLICIAISTIVTDYLQNGFSKKKSVYIISNKKEQIQNYIHTQVNRGTTLIKAEGGYSHEPKEMIMAVVSNTELRRIREYILEHDPTAFIIIGSVTEVLGHGFSMQQKFHTNEEV